MTPDYTYLVVPLRPPLIDEFIQNIRMEDWLEMQEAAGMQPSAALAEAISRPDFVNLIMYRQTPHQEPLAVVGGVPINGQLNVYLMVTKLLKLPDMVFLRRGLNEALANLKIIAGVPEDTEVVCDVWDVNTAHVRWCLGAGFYPTGNIKPAPTQGTFLEMIYTCVPPPS